MVILFITT